MQISVLKIKGVISKQLGVLSQSENYSIFLHIKFINLRKELINNMVDIIS